MSDIERAITYARSEALAVADVVVALIEWRAARTDRQDATNDSDWHGAGRRLEQAEAELAAAADAWLSLVAP